MPQPSTNRDRIVQRLTKRPHTRVQLQQALELCEAVVWRWVKLLHDARQIHVDEWCRPKGCRRYVPVYALGDGPDAPKPEGKTKAQEDRDYRARRRKDPARMADERARKRRRYWATKPAFRDPLTAALFGN